MLMHDDNLRHHLGQRIKALRKKRGWPQKELAAQLGVGLSVLNRYESGIHAPPVEALVQLSTLLETTLDYLVAGHDAATDAPLHNRRLLDRLGDLQDLDDHEQELVIELIDAVVAKKRVTSAVRPRKRSA
jgi:transcriptional regulator with XRE-family HTH domain